jgi:hypothetical protein
MVRFDASSAISSSFVSQFSTFSVSMDGTPRALMSRWVRSFEIPEIIPHGMPAGVSSMRERPVTARPDFNSADELGFLARYIENICISCRRVFRNNESLIGTSFRSPLVPAVIAK